MGDMARSLVHVRRPAQGKYDRLRRIRISSTDNDIPSLDYDVESFSDYTSVYLAYIHGGAEHGKTGPPVIRASKLGSYTVRGEYP